MDFSAYLIVIIIFVSIVAGKNIAGGSKNIFHPLRRQTALHCAQASPAEKELINYVWNCWLCW